MAIPDGEKSLRIRLLVLTEFTNVTDRQTDRRTDTAYAALVYHCAAKIRSLDEIRLNSHRVSLRHLALLTCYRQVLRIGTLRRLVPICKTCQ